MAKFEKGKSGNPGGRPKLAASIRDACLAQTEKNIETLISLRDDAKQPGNVRLGAVNAMLDRAIGKPPQAVVLDPFGIGGLQGEGREEMLSTLESLREMAFQVGLIKHMQGEAAEDTIH